MQWLCRSWELGAGSWANLSWKLEPRCIGPDTRSSCGRVIRMRYPDTQPIQAKQQDDVLFQGCRRSRPASCWSRPARPDSGRRLSVGGSRARAGRRGQPRQETGSLASYSSELASLSRVGTVRTLIRRWSAVARKRKVGWWGDAWRRERVGVSGSGSGYSACVPATPGRGPLSAHSWTFRRIRFRESGPGWSTPGLQRGGVR